MKEERSGFTLAELLIVVAVIAVLVAVSIPVFQNQLEKSRNAVDLANAKNIKNAITYYYMDNPDAMERLKETCDAERAHFITVQVGRPKSEGYSVGYAGGTAISDPDLQQALIDAGLISEKITNTSKRYYDITCASKKNWWGYIIAITNYQSLGAANNNPNRDLVIKVIGVPKGDTVHIIHSWADFSNDKTGFSRAFSGS